jgi:hypothetical protein
MLQKKRNRPTKETHLCIQSITPQGNSQKMMLWPCLGTPMSITVLLLISVSY